MATCVVPTFSPVFRRHPTPSPSTCSPPHASSSLSASSGRRPLLFLSQADNTRRFKRLLAPYPEFAVPAVVNQARAMLPPFAPPSATFPFTHLLPRSDL